MLKVTFRNNAPVSAVILGVMFVLAINLSILCGAIWIGGSVLTSVIKATTDSCDSHLVLENAFSGNWFCPEKK